MLNVGVATLPQSLERGGERGEGREERGEERERTGEGNVEEKM